MFKYIDGKENCHLFPNSACELFKRLKKNIEVQNCGCTWVLYLMNNVSIDVCCRVSDHRFSFKYIWQNFALLLAGDWHCDHYWNITEEWLVNFTIVLKQPWWSCVVYSADLSCNLRRLKYAVFTVVKSYPSAF